MSRKRKSSKSTLHFYGIPITKETLLYTIYIIAIFVAIFILTDSIIVKNSGWAEISFLFLGVSIWGAHRTKLENSKNLYKKVAWIAEKSPYNSSCRLRDFELAEYIEFEQKKLNIPQQFNIDFSNETEKEHIIKILDTHKNHVVKSYFCDRLSESKKIYNLETKNYYFLSLYNFIYNNQYKQSLYSNREYISDYRYKCQLTEYGRVYYKLYLIIWLYVKDNEQIKNFFEYIDKEKENYILEILEKNEAYFFN